MKIVLLAFSLLFLLVPCVQANKAVSPREEPSAPNPDAPKKGIAGTPVALKIRAEKGLGETSLQVPRKVIKILDPHDAEKDVQSRGISPSQTIVAGLALSVALGLGGLQLARRRWRGGMIVVVAVLAIGTGALAASKVFADRAPANPTKVAKEDANGHTVSMPAAVQIMESGDVVELNIDLDRAKELLAAGEKK